MAHVVTERCVDCRYTDCCTVCPVDCFYEVTSPAMLVIDPNVCIDCGLCVPECPIAAIWPVDELPAAYAEWTDKNAALAASGTGIKIKKDALPGALPLDKIQAREKSRGWSINEPSGAKGGGEHAGAGAAPAAAPARAVEAGDILGAFKTERYKWRSARGIAKELSADTAAVQAELTKLAAAGKLEPFKNTNAQAPPVYRAA